MSLLSYFTGTEDQSVQDANLAASKERFQQALAQRVADGTITPEDTALQQAYVSSVTDDSELAATEQGFEEGAAQGFQNVLSAPGKVIGFAGDSAGSLLGGVLKNIPWWAYLVGLGVLFVYLGGLPVLKRVLGNRLARIQ